MQDNELLKYSLGPCVEAFTTIREAQLPYPVLCGHQVHGYKEGVVDREGMTRDDHLKESVPLKCDGHTIEPI